jgi:hypothetical protein
MVVKESMMRKILLLAALVALSAIPAAAQNSTYGAITAAATSCTGNFNDSACVRLQMPSGQATASVTVLGTFSATLAVERSANNGASWVSAGVSFTTTGTRTFNVSAYTDLRVRASAFTSGTARITILSSTAGSGGGSDLDGVTFDFTTSAPVAGDVICFNSASPVVGVPCALSTTFGSSVFFINGSADPTKQLAFDVETNVPTGTIVTVKAPAAAGTIPTTTALTSLKVWTCEIVVGDPGAASSVLADDNDTPGVCANDTAVTKTITAVHCYANTGSPTVTPIVNGGGATSILSGAGTCDQTAGGASLALQGTPTLTTGQLVDTNITTAGGAAKYIVVRITGTLP